MNINRREKAIKASEEADQLSKTMDVNSDVSLEDARTAHVKAAHLNNAASRVKEMHRHFLEEKRISDLQYDLFVRTEIDSKPKGSQ
jgi:hypothetical protein